MYVGALLIIKHLSYPILSKVKDKYALGPNIRYDAIRKTHPHHLRVQVGGIKKERHHRDRLNHEGRKPHAYHPPFLRPQDDKGSARESLETGWTHFGGSRQSPLSAREFKDSPCAAWCVPLVRR